MRQNYLYSETDKDIIAGIYIRMEFLRESFFSSTDDRCTNDNESESSDATFSNIYPPLPEEYDDPIVPPTPRSSEIEDNSKNKNRRRNIISPGFLRKSENENENENVNGNEIIIPVQNNNTQREKTPVQKNNNHNTSTSWCEIFGLWWFHHTTPNIPQTPREYPNNMLFFLPTKWIWCECDCLPRQYCTRDIELCCCICWRTQPTPMASREEMH